MVFPRHIFGASYARKHINSAKPFDAIFFHCIFCIGLDIYLSCLWHFVSCMRATGGTSIQPNVSTPSAASHDICILECGCCRDPSVALAKLAYLHKLPISEISHCQRNGNNTKFRIPLFAFCNFVMNPRHKQYYKTQNM